MLHLINSLCKNNNLNNQQDFETFLVEKFNQENKSNSNKNLIETIKSLISYKHPQTGDTILNYAARFGNANLIKLIYEHYTEFHPNQFLNSCNNDGKNGLHVVLFKNEFDLTLFSL